MKIPRAPKTIEVPADYPTIKQAVDAASQGDTIVVSEGVYPEGEIWVTKPGLSFVADGTVVVDGLGERWAFYVVADNVTINGFEVVNSKESLYGGITLDHARGCRIENNTAKNNHDGLYLWVSSNNTIIGNMASFNEGDGISLLYSYGNVLINNTATNNDRYGIYVGASDNNTLISNTATDNKFGGIKITDSYGSVLTGNTAERNRYYGIFLGRHGSNILRDNNMTDNEQNFGVSGEDLPDFMNDIDPSNFVDGKHVYYLVEQDNITVDPNTFPDIGYVGIINSTGVTVRNIKTTNNMHGVFFAYVTNSTIENVTATNHYIGINLYGSSDNIIKETTVARNKWGIHVWRSHCNTVIRNAVSNNTEEGIRITGSSYNLILHNKASNNTSGIYLQSGYNNTINGNILEKNIIRLPIPLSGGVCILVADNNTISENTLYKNDYGVFVSVSAGNTIYHNNFCQNTEQAYSWASTSTWDDAILQVATTGETTTEQTCTVGLSRTKREATASATHHT